MHKKWVDFLRIIELKKWVVNYNYFGSVFFPRISWEFSLREFSKLKKNVTIKVKKLHKKLVDFSRIKRIK